MVLENLSLVGFRNLKPVEINFSRTRNLIQGENGAGKSNLLEAIYYLCMGKSFRKAIDNEILQYDAQFFRIEGGGERRVIVYYSPAEKRIILDKNEIKKLSDFAGWLPAVIFSLEDIWLVRGEPRGRREYLDMAIGKVSRSYLKNLFAYRRVLHQRNRILENIKEQKYALDAENRRLIESFEDGLISYGNEIYRLRSKYFVFLSSRLSQYCDQFNLKNIKLSYRSSVENQFMERGLLEKNRPLEISKGVTLFGPHRDDLLISKNGRDLKIFGSEGEQRIASLALRLAEAALIEQERNEEGLKLVDEAVAELDTGRRTVFLDNLQGQVFFATTQPVDNFGKHFLITEGKIEETD